MDSASAVFIQQTKLAVCQLDFLEFTGLPAGRKNFLRQRGADETGIVAQMILVMRILTRGSRRREEADKISSRFRLVTSAATV
jgi:hypothetical protein